MSFWAQKVHLDYIFHKLRCEVRNVRVPNWVCIYIPEYVYIPFPELGYVKGMYFPKMVCNYENFGEVTIK